MENFDNKILNINSPADKELLSRARIPWKKTTVEAWNEVSARITAPAAGKTPVRHILKPAWAAAASLGILVCSSLFFLRFYTSTVSTVNTEERTLKFRDGSFARLNTGSTLTYHPFWYSLSRKVFLAGEGYFEVTSGQRFEVRSEHGITSVLGTRFNILARSSTYEVSCLSGKVRVESKITEDALILLPDEKASLNDHGKLDLNRVEKLEKQIGWIQTEWVYTDEPLTRVIRAIEAQYNIKIILPAGDRHRFTGGFDKTMPVQSVLDLVCTPFGYTFTRKANGEFEIYPK